ncbi:MAG: site-specific integrase, partial [Planctomycetota bacterium]|nr:site-specific integrase [Planctomycetota bacterium]
MIDPFLDEIGKESQRSIKSHLTDYEAKLKTASPGDNHVRTTLNYVRAIADVAGFNIASDITADGVNLYAQQLRDLGRPVRTVEAYLTAIKGFSKWLMQHHKLPRDPLASVKKPNPKTDRRRERRMLLPEEWRWLEATTSGSGTNYGMTGYEPVMRYRTGIETGLRSSELRSLNRSRLFLAGESSYITCKALSTKNSKLAKQYLQTDLAMQLREHIRTKAPQAPVFGLPSTFDMANMLRDDLAAARRVGLAQANHDPEELERRQQSDFLYDTNHDGEVLDFHSLRHTCGAWLARVGIHPKAVQVVMRHSTITLTMDVYGHLFPGQEADAVTSLRTPDLGSTTLSFEIRVSWSGA